MFDDICNEFVFRFFECFMIFLDVSCMIFVR